MSLFVIDPASPSYVALRETGEHLVRRDAAGALWVGGSTRTVAAGHVDL